MNVYEINGYWIAAKNKNEAYYQFLEEENNLEDVFDNELELHENDEDNYEITIRRVTTKELSRKDIRYHNYDEDDCETCKDNDDYTYQSLQDRIDQTDPEKFPCVLAKEE